MTTTQKFLIERPIGYADALASLKPKAKWAVSDNDINGIDWYEENEDDCPTKEELDAEIVRLQNEKDATEYQSKREPEYPSLKVFADAYYWAQKGDTTKMDEYIQKCDEVKASYPKPNKPS